MDRYKSIKTSCIAFFFIFFFFCAFFSYTTLNALPESNTNGFAPFFQKQTNPKSIKQQNSQNIFQGDPSLKLLADVLPIALVTLQTFSIQEPNLKDLCLRGIQKLLERDTDIELTLDGHNLVLSKTKNRIDTFSTLQPNNDLSYWTVTSLNIVNRAMENSPKLYTLPPEKLVSVLMKGIMSGLDSLSRYIPPHKANPAHFGPLGITQAEEAEVTSWSQIYDKTLYLRIKHFGPWTSQEIISLLKNARESYEGVILDLRDNLGGRLEQAVEIADAFLDKGIVAQSKGRHPESYQKFEANGAQAIYNKPLLLIVNEKSASAAEVLAAALKENNRALVLGDKTYGKGTIQRVQNLPNGGAIAFTWAKLYTPKGNELNEHGVTPFLTMSNLKPNQLTWLKAQMKNIPQNANVLKASFITKAKTDKIIFEKEELELALVLLASPDLYQKALSFQVQQ